MELISINYLPNERPHYFPTIFKEFSNIHLHVNWSEGTKTTTLNLLICPADDTTQIIQTKELSASASRGGEEFGAEGCFHQISRNLERDVRCGQRALCG